MDIYCTGFQHSANLQLDLQKCGEKKVVVDKKTKALPDFAFFGNGNLESIDLPEGLLEIGDYAFAFCPLGGEIKIPSTVKKMGKNVFWGCGKANVSSAYDEWIKYYLEEYPKQCRLDVLETADMATGELKRMLKRSGKAILEAEMSRIRAQMNHDKYDWRGFFPYKVLTVLCGADQSAEEWDLEWDVVSKGVFSKQRAIVKWNS